MKFDRKRLAMQTTINSNNLYNIDVSELDPNYLAEKVRSMTIKIIQDMTHSDLFDLVDVQIIPYPYDEIDQTKIIVML